MGTFYSQLGNTLFPPWELFIPMVGKLYQLGSNGDLQYPFRVVSDAKLIVWSFINQPDNTV